jgi:hypothetical protein
MADDDKKNPFGEVRSNLNLSGRFGFAGVVQTHSGSGHNIVANNVTLENSDRQLHDPRFNEFRAQLLKGDRNARLVVEYSMSDAEAEAFAHQICDFLLSNGFKKIFRNSYMGGNPLRGQHVDGNLVRVGRR